MPDLCDLWVRYRLSYWPIACFICSWVATALESFQDKNLRTSHEQGALPSLWLPYRRVKSRHGP